MSATAPINPAIPPKTKFLLNKDVVAAGASDMRSIASGLGERFNIVASKLFGFPSADGFCPVMNGIGACICGGSIGGGPACA